MKTLSKSNQMKFQNKVLNLKTSDITIEEFYQYKIKSFQIDNITYYSVSNLLNQYNKINGTNHTINDWLKIEHTQRLMQYLLDNSRNEDLRFSISSKKVFIPGSIIYKKFDNHSQGYWCVGYILNMILANFDNVFAIQIFNYIENKRLKDNEAMIEKLQRVVPCDNGNNWSFFISVSFTEEEAIISLNYSREHQHKPRNIIYRVDNIPNGYTLKKNVHQSILKNVNHLQYIEKSRYKYCVDRYLYDLNPDYFINKIRAIAASERRMLEWRNDIKSK